MTPIHLAKETRKDLVVFLIDHGADARSEVFFLDGPSCGGPGQARGLGRIPVFRAGST